ncbi:hypothetical protein HYH03_017663 [Edaphochlamys debaryana]|uniref:Uncharacterized protein n=1 Tax=Edaphochlamys debaryana TaxID=47281 RepID=A0A835XGT8_9CHLO|nr:hypothetical protein HYH03_017663 [Edaphochlamys debaryana]|eukprot:KAG2483481.1 hypothetical protein HYH03_017663 [Edaphochlamys debaryana]
MLDNIATWLGFGQGEQWHMAGSAADAFSADLTHHGRQLLSDRVAGVGTAVFVFFFFLALCLTICLIGAFTKQRWVVYVISTAVFGIVCLVLFASPKGPKKPKPETGYDQTIVALVFIMVILCLGIVAAAVFMLILHVLPTVYARPLSYHLDIIQMRN